MPKPRVETIGLRDAITRAGGVGSVVSRLNEFKRLDSKFEYYTQIVHNWLRSKHVPAMHLRALEHVCADTSDIEWLSEDLIIFKPKCSQPVDCASVERHD